ncbi:MAG: NAD(P)-binding domain-containing protein, partial [Planctomycetales bacterium]|nr:NAD(P)-binding domain-containing protein [Planctomycetales bacterium]
TPATSHDQSPMTTNHKICIIGAGCSGMVAAKILQERGLPFDCFEKGSDIGGLWRYNNDSGTSAAYQSLHINTSRDKMAFSDFPMPREYPDFPHHSLILKYFESYAEHFGIRQHVTFQTTVERVEPRGPNSYAVTVTDGMGRRRTHSYRAVLVANGHHWKPRFATFPGNFAGQLLHAHDYREPTPFTDQRVLVVGIGNSACDIACEVSRVAQKTYLSTRRGAHIIPKYMFGKPLDRVAPAWFWRHLPFPLFQRLFGATLYLARGRLKRYGLPTPPHRVLQEHPTISADLLNLIGHGKIAVKPQIDRLAGPSVHFMDGSTIDVDTMVLATGYQIAFPFLDTSILDPAGNRVHLYKHVVHTEHPGLYFIGLIQPWGAIMPLAEQQAEWVADLLQTQCTLPSRQRMLSDIDRTQNRMRRRYVLAERHTIQVDFYPYLDELRRARQHGRGAGGVRTGHPPEGRAAGHRRAA